MHIDGPRLPRIDETWDIEDPEGHELPDVRRIRDDVKRRVLGLVGAIRRNEIGLRSNKLVAEQMVGNGSSAAT